ncbi:hypothetical protein RFI_35712 [Reticulomyxa filosa]|uniref:Uncharacterized protein n=1 Tax=Reticulomyxa filosa TaxID=46433 RepID=X6LKR5_RETFI|nr:hypothetical protein RFI_35712 [Reticulomyxa filosa]|eukprot:ETO01727.1 hypothetical protein RFI_35712 [Reticulomyxa filosa]
MTCNASLKKKKKKKKGGKNEMKSLTSEIKNIQVEEKTPSSDNTDKSVRPPSTVNSEVSSNVKPTAKKTKNEEVDEEAKEKTHKDKDKENNTANTNASASAGAGGLDERKQQMMEKKLKAWEYLCVSFIFQIKHENNSEFLQSVKMIPAFKSQDIISDLTYDKHPFSIQHN